MERHIGIEEERAVRITTLADSGMSQRQVAQHLGINQSTVSRILLRFRETGSNRRQRGQGRRTATSAADNRYLHLAVLRNRSLTSV